MCYLSARISRLCCRYWQQPQTAWALALQNAAGTRLRSCGVYVWFFGPGDDLISIVRSPGTDLTDVNVYASNSVYTGDIRIPSDTNNKRWFTNGITAQLQH